MAKNSSEKKDVSEKKIVKRNEKYILGPMHFSVRFDVFRDYFEAFHAVHSCSQSLLFITANPHTMFNTYIYHQLPTLTNTQRQGNNERGPLNISAPFRTQTQLRTVNTYIANVHNKQQRPTDFNVLQLRISTNIFTIFKTQILMCYS
jgi:hypothetical protein